MPKLNILQIIFLDFIYGIHQALSGLKFLIRLWEEDSKEMVTVEAPRKHVKTVMDLRREKELGVKRRVPDAPKKKETVMRRLFDIYTVNIVFLILWKLTIFTLSPVLDQFGLFGWGQILGETSLIPLFYGSRIYQAICYSDIAGACLRALRMRPPSRESAIKMLEESITSLVHQTFFLFQCALLYHLPLPLVSPLIAFFHISLLNSMYCFDYMFSAFEVYSARRRFYFDSHWPFFIGFGTPLALACSLTDDTFMKAMIFSFLFPLFIISSYTANWNRDYGREIPRIQFCRIASMFTKLVMDQFKRMTTSESA